MITAFFLCTVMIASIECVPFETRAACRIAERALVTALVEKSDCTRAELRAGTEYAPEHSPLPPVKPL